MADLPRIIAITLVLDRDDRWRAKAELEGRCVDLGRVTAAAIADGVRGALRAEDGPTLADVVAEVEALEQTGAFEGLVEGD